MWFWRPYVLCACPIVLHAWFDCRMNYIFLMSEPIRSQNGRLLFDDCRLFLLQVFKINSLRIYSTIFLLDCHS